MTILEYLTPERDYYTADGEEVYLVGNLVREEPRAAEVTGYLVNRYVIVSYGDGEEDKQLSEFPVVVHRLHRQRPAVRQSPAAKALEQEVADLKTLRDDLSKQIHDQRIAMQDHRRDLASCPDFGLATDFIEGRITHVVIGSNPPRIMTTEEALHPKENYRNRPTSGPIKLVSLTGYYDVKGDRITGWKQSAYADGSGSENDIQLCRSREEAEAEVRKRFFEACAAHRASKSFDGAGRKWGWHTLKEWERCGVTLEWPTDIVQEISEAVAGNYAARVAKAQEDLENALEEPKAWAP
jgi:hypothetical protein